MPTVPSRRRTPVTDALPSLEGRTVVVTGGASGIGYFVSERLARLGARVVIAARNPDRGAAAARSIGELVPGADVDFRPLDLADLESVRTAADRLATGGRIDAVVANAGVIGYPAHTAAKLPPQPATTADGHELHWGTNHLGHFAFVAALLPALLESGGRVVHVGSLSHRAARIPADLVPAPDEPGTALQLYARSKLAAMSFGFTLARRLEASGATATSVVVHPGVAVDALDPIRPGVVRNQPVVRAPGVRTMAALLAQGKDGGARSAVAAVASPQVRNGDYWGPSRPGQLAGRPGPLRPTARAVDPAAGERLVGVSEELSGTVLPV